MTLLLFTPAQAAAAQIWSERLGLIQVPLGDRRGQLEALRTRQHEFALLLDEAGLALQALDKPLPGPVRVDFAGGTLRWRLEHGGGRGEMVAKACGVKKDATPSILDATAGLGRDALILASLGCSVRMCERSPIIAALLEDGLARAAVDAELASIVARMQLLPSDSLQVLQQVEQQEQETEQPDVVYLDPMFPHRDKSALVKKEMRVFREVVGDDIDADQLLASALLAARKRVVVKRPRGAPWLASCKPALVLEGKSGRFDVYLV